MMTATTSSSKILLFLRLFSFYSVVHSFFSQSFKVMAIIVTLVKIYLKLFEVLSIFISDKFWLTD